ncbi:uncharacterized protein LOC134765742 [Penaeus indicus]|uniref:uncharacterized protein LOC134765742 n=1 Tax=Penaeus indicus TaxID=29960 RepID=UPI00300D7C5A
MYWNLSRRSHTSNGHIRSRYTERVPRDGIWRSLRLKGEPEYIVMSIKDMYQHSTTMVRSTAGETDPFEVRVGLHQGEELNQILEGWREKLEDRGRRISRLKTECMKCHFGEEDEQEVDLEIDLEVLRETDIFTYLGSMGAETWATTKREEERLGVKEMRMLRWTRGVTIRDRVSNRHIRGSLHVTEVARKIKRGD